MDHQDGISRRDAVIGVSFLGVLMAALSATIVYRIVDAQPPKGPRKAPPITVAPPIELEDNPLPIPSFDGEIETVAHEEPISASTGDRPNESFESASPTFVAPSGRPN
jgi:hypothetical protein